MTNQSIFSAYPRLIFGWSDKKDGPMKISEVTSRTALINRQRFLKTLGIDPDSVVSGEIVHGNHVETVRHDNLRTTLTGTDALLTNEKNIFLAVTIADCLPIFLYNPKTEVVGLIHAGWRGLANNVIDKTITKLATYYNANPQQTIALIGPAIGSCHFEIKSEVKKIFETEYDKQIIWREHQIFLDLKQIAKRQLRKAGIAETQISINKDCTFCDSTKYFSFRRDHSQPLETMIAIIGLK